MGLAITAMGAIALVTFTKMVKKYVEVGDMIDKMSKRTGFAAETLSELAYAAEISGADLSLLEKGVKSMAKTIAFASDGLETYLREFRKIGVNVDELMKLNPEQQFLMIAEAIAKVEHASIKSAAAQVIFGRAGMMLLPLFAEGEKGMKALADEAHRLGIIFDEEAAAKAAKLKDAQTSLSKAFQGLGFALAEEFIPVLTDVTTAFTDMTVDMQGNMKSLVLGMVEMFKIAVEGIQGMMLAWNAFKILTLEAGKGVAGFGKTALTWFEKQLKKADEVFPAITEKEKKAYEHSMKFRKTLMGLTENLSVVEKGYRQEVEKLIDSTTNIIIKYDKWIARLNNISIALTTTKDKTKELGEATKEISKTFKINVEDVLKKAIAAAENYRGIVDVFTDKTKKMTEAEIVAYGALMSTYEGSITGMISFFERWAAAAAVKWAMVTYPPPVNLIVAAATMLGVKGLFSAIKGFAKGGDISTEGGIVGEAGPELFIPDRPGKIVPPRETRAIMGGITIAPVMNINTIDAVGVQEFMRNKGITEIIEALRIGIKKYEFKEALGV